MAKTERKGVEEARNQLPKLIEAAEAGRTTVITRRGRAVAALVPLDVYGARQPQQSLLSVAGSGRGLWGSDSARSIDNLRDEEGTRT
ncbi:MAG TPA: type II toxin-antitoxin system Phd/YefM family antitoxin [Gammaproteobacteria bacterium]|nr:type II toxin-antitoxin system Phd/YefM family antitoxin [Gammaproteobacteria bacterium]